MKTRLLIIVGIVTAILVSLLASDQYYLSLQDKELKKSHWVQNCIPVGTGGAVPAIGLFNHTHSFDLQTCSWNPTEHGKPGFLESLYISFIEPFFADLSSLLFIQYAYACTCVADFDPSQAIPESDYAFLGVVTNIEKSGEYQTITFDIKDSIKGNLNKTHTIHERALGGPSCGIEYKINHLYFVNEKDETFDPVILEWTGTVEGLESEPELIFSRTNMCTTQDMGVDPFGMKDVTAEYSGDEYVVNVEYNQGLGPTMGIIVLVALAIGIVGIIIVTRRKPDR